MEFEVDETKNGTEPVNLIIEGELSPSAAVFTSAASSVSSRPKTTAKVQWSVPNWVAVGDHGPDQTTPSIASIIQEIVNQNGWAGGRRSAAPYRLSVESRCCPTWQMGPKK